tara:strand:- start:11322 stop:12740 length:1419 start_codon:yes stop_codon:yes gene_type:complete
LKIICVIPARGGSKRLSRKNIHPLMGKPLILWSVEACLKSKYLNYDNIFVSTEDSEIRDISKAAGIKVIDRPEELSKDDVWTQDVLSHAKDFLLNTGEDFDIMVRIQANSPQIQSEKIDECIEKLINKKLWEVFTVDSEGVEDASIHALLKKCIDQKALSVYKGVVATDYVDVHTLADIKRVEKIISLKHEAQDEYDITKDKIIDISKDFSKKIETFLKNKKYEIIEGSLQGFPPISELDLREWHWHFMSAWHWNLRFSLVDRFEKSLSSHSVFFSEISKKTARGERVKILDLCSGFCVYWPILCEIGVSEIVGIDLYDDREKIVTKATLQDSSIRLQTITMTIRSMISSNLNNDIFQLSRKSIESLFEAMERLWSNSFEMFCRSRQAYYDTSRELVDNFTRSDFQYRLFRGNIDSIDLYLSPDDEQSFDGIMCIAPGGKKETLGTGVSRETLDYITKKYLKKGGVTAFDGR